MLRYISYLLIAVLFLPLAVHAQEDSDGWQELAAMPKPRSEYAGVAYDGKLYTLGGYGSGYGDQNAARVFEVYDIATDTWEQLPEFPETGRHHLMLAEIDGLLYAFGGASIDPFETASYNTFVFDPVASEWSMVAPMPTYRYAGAAVVFEDSLYVVGGVGLRRANNQMLRYTPATDEWETLGQQPVVRDHVAAVLYQGEIWAIGGRELGIEDYTSVSIYNFETEEWREGPSLNTGRAGFGAVVVNDRIYVAGGEILAGCDTFPCNDPGEVAKTVEMYDPATDEWLIVTETPVAVHGLPLMAYDGVIYVASGSTIPGGIFNPGDTFAWQPPNTDT